MSSCTQLQLCDVHVVLVWRGEADMTFRSLCLQSFLQPMNLPRTHPPTCTPCMHACTYRSCHDDGVRALLSDGLHLSKSGNAVVAQALTDTMERAFPELSPDVLQRGMPRTVRELELCDFQGTILLYQLMIAHTRKCNHFQAHVSVLLFYCSCGSFSLSDCLPWQDAVNALKHGP